MRVLNLNINENLADWGIKVTPSQKRIVLRNEAINYDVYKIPIDLLVYNLKNGRIFMEVKKKESDNSLNFNEMKDEDTENYNNEIEKLIWETSEEKNEYTKNDIQKFGQLEPGVVLADGTVIDGNRRFTCLRKLHREHPENEDFNYFLAAIIKVDGEKITNKLLKEYELRVQFGSDEKVGYKAINKNMSIYELVEKSGDDGLDYTTVASLVNKKPSEIIKICKTCKLVEEFLEYVGQSLEYQLAEDYNIYWPLEALTGYLDGDGKNLTPIQKQARKNLFFDYLITLDVSLMTQNLRDNLIKKVFKDNETTQKLIDEHNQIMQEPIQEVIDSSNTADEFKDNVDELAHSDSATQDKELYERVVNKIKDINQLDLPLKICKKIVDLLDDLNIKFLLDADTEIANQKLDEIKNLLSTANDKLKEKIVDIDNGK